MTINSANRSGLFLIKNPRQAWLLAILPLFGAVLLDQGLKNLYQAVVINENIAWSIPWLPDSSSFRTLIILFIIGGLILMAYRQLSTRWKSSTAVLYGLLIGAAISNWLDRVFLGGVRDIWFLPKLQVVNNPADWLLVLSVTGLILIEIFEALKAFKSAEK